VAISLHYSVFRLLYSVFCILSSEFSFLSTPRRESFRPVLLVQPVRSVRLNNLEFYLPRHKSCLPSNVVVGGLASNCNFIFLTISNLRSQISNLFCLYSQISNLISFLLLRIILRPCLSNVPVNFPCEHISPPLCLILLFRVVGKMPLPLYIAVLQIVRPPPYLSGT